MTGCERWCLVSGLHLHVVGSHLRAGCPWRWGALMRSSSAWNNPCGAQADLRRSTAKARTIGPAEGVKCEGPAPAINWFGSDKALSADRSFLSLTTKNGNVFLCDDSSFDAFQRL